MNRPVRGRHVQRGGCAGRGDLPNALKPCLKQHGLHRGRPTRRFAPTGRINRPRPLDLIVEASQTGLPLARTSRLGPRRAAASSCLLPKAATPFEGAAKPRPPLRMNPG